MSGEEKDIFTKISNPAERSKLFYDLASSKVEILCKGQEDQIFKLKAEGFNSTSGFLECRSDDGKVPFKKQEDIIGYFFLGSEKYYFRALVHIIQNKMQLLINENVFQLQRRQNYRVRIPASYKAYFNIIDVNGASQSIPGKLADLSGGGCRVIYNMKSPLMKIDDSVVGTLFIGSRDPIDISGVVRHIKIDAPANTIQTFGIEFTKMTPIIENRLVSLTMDLYKEIFKNV